VRTRLERRPSVLQPLAPLPTRSRADPRVRSRRRDPADMHAQAILACPAGADREMRDRRGSVCESRWGGAGRRDHRGRTRPRARQLPSGRRWRRRRREPTSAGHSWGCEASRWCGRLPRRGFASRCRSVRRWHPGHPRRSGAPRHRLRPGSPTRRAQAPAAIQAGRPRERGVASARAVAPQRARERRERVAPARTPATHNSLAPTTLDSSGISRARRPVAREITGSPPRPAGP
jgi:hypothetical protein